MADAGGSTVGPSTGDALEAILTRVPGIRAARVVSDGDRISEIHVIAGTDRGAKQLVRDIQSAAKASLDVEIDYRTVSIVQLEDAPAPHTVVLPDVPAALAVSTPRMPLRKVVGHATGQLATIEVILGDGPGERIGVARGVASRSPELVARATLDAYLPNLGDIVPEIIAADLATIGESEIAVVLIRLVSAADVREIVGAAVVSGDRNDAFARATLDGVNRMRS